MTIQHMLFVHKMHLLTIHLLFFSRMSEVLFKRNKKHNKRQSASAARKKGNQDNEMNDLQAMAGSSSSGNVQVLPNSAQSITLHEFFISKGKCI